MNYFMSITQVERDCYGAKHCTYTFCADVDRSGSVSAIGELN